MISPLKVTTLPLMGTILSFQATIFLIQAAYFNMRENYSGKILAFFSTFQTFATGFIHKVHYNTGY